MLFLNKKNKQKNKGTLIFKQYHLLPDSIMTLYTPYYLSLIISFFLYFPFKCIHSSFEIHSVFVTVTVARSSIYPKNLIAMLFVHSMHLLSTQIIKTCQQSHRHGCLPFTKKSPELSVGMKMISLFWSSQMEHFRRKRDK